MHGVCLGTVHKSKVQCFMVDFQSFLKFLRGEVNRGFSPKTATFTLLVIGIGTNRGTNSE